MLAALIKPNPFCFKDLRESANPIKLAPIHIGIINLITFGEMLESCFKKERSNPTKRNKPRHEQPMVSMGVKIFIL
jgi:hypothetical protein